MVLVALLVYAWAGAVALARPISDFYAAGHAIPAAYNGMAIAACFVAALAYPTLAGVLGPGWRGSLLVLAGGAGALLAIAFLLAPYLRRFGGYTLPDFLGERFGSAGLRPLAVAAVFLCSFPALAAVLLALAVIVTRLFALDLPSSLGAAVAMLFLCTFLGGMRSASRAGVLQYAVMLAGSVAALTILLWQRRATSGALDASALLDALAALNLDMFVAPDRVNRIALVFCLVAGTAALPHLVVRTFTARSIEEARSSFLYAVPLLLVLFFLAAPAYAPLFSGEAVAAGDTLSGVSMGLIATAAIANGQGALAGMIAGLIVCLYYMIVPRYFPYAFYETSRLFSSASEQQASAYDLLQRMYYLADPANRPAVAMLWELNVRAIANWWGVRGIFAGVFGVPVGLVVTIAVSLLTPAPSEDVQSFVEDLRKPQPA
jgi:Na+(H+)/acetate symporter ActP